ncbi:mechanosensitive ion channel family protein [Dielma fastidiosa]|uniref:Small-conductance mechanosensitive channel n=1 Tax=Dielma fastidiosa TaxID=1034346 RepID=A0A318KJ69_9FIRM|nr:mechanosensitive ion channel family protein [Dielma fastidiosa]PXX77819.1 small-conductance mechanosensitive channel [Dielma fastidiosa]RHM97830.1 mechanosensitive ion channel family protein [Dielma fastidiosa]
MQQILTMLNSFFMTTFIDALLTMLFLFLLITLLKKLLIHIVLKYENDNQQIIIKLIKIGLNIVLILGICYQFTALKEIVKTLLTGGGVLALVLGLAAQEAVGNLVSGMMILFFKPFKVGDLIKTNNGLVGTVLDISLRHTVIKTYENTQIMIPNSEINKATLENVTAADFKGDFLILQISYESDLDLAISIIAEEIMKHPDFLDLRSAAEKTDGIPAVKVRCTNFLDSGIELKAALQSRSSAVGYAMLSDLRISIKKRFDEAGIVIPYPQVVIHQN